MNGRPRQDRGFTLVEVLVALVVVAIALGALVRTTGQAATTQFEAERRTLALWIASNQLAALSLEPSLEAGRRAGQTRMGEHDWRWQATIAPAPGGELWRIDVVVADAEDRTVAAHSGYLPR